jgi:hypothetical protein
MRPDGRKACTAWTPWCSAYLKGAKAPSALRRQSRLHWAPTRKRWKPRLSWACCTLCKETRTGPSFCGSGVRRRRRSRACTHKSDQNQAGCPLYPLEQTSSVRPAMSAKGYEETSFAAPVRKKKAALRRPFSFNQVGRAPIGLTAPIDQFSDTLGAPT